MKYRIDPVAESMEQMDVIGTHEFEGNSAMLGEMSRHSDGINGVFQYAPEELIVLFKDWLNDMEDDVLAFAGEKASISADDVSGKFNVSGDSASFILKRLHGAGRLKTD